MRKQGDGGQEISAYSSPWTINKGILTSTRAHRGVLHIKESLSVSRHSGGRLRERSKRQK